MNKLQKKLGYAFKDKKNLTRALTHSSYVKEKELAREECNERLEFLGDGILEAIICERLFFDMPREAEGKMAKIKSDIVKANTLADIAIKLELGKYLILGNGEELYGGRKKKNILADAVEAIIGAIFLESGFDKAKKIVLDIFSEKLDIAYEGKLDENHKSNFQEMVHKTGETNIRYVLTGEEGKSHDKTFYMDVFVGDELFGSGFGKSKKQAENEAAKSAIRRMDKRGEESL